MARQLGIPFLGRPNRENLSGLGMLVYPDLVGVGAEVDRRLVVVAHGPTAPGA